MKRYALFTQIALVCVSAVLMGCGSPSRTDLEANKEVVFAFAEATNNGEWDKLDELMTENFVRHSQATPEVQVRSRDEFKDLQKKFLTIFPDQHVQIETIIAEGDYVAIYATYSGTQEGPMPPFPASGKKAESKFLGLFRLDSGKIAEFWVEWDNLAFLKQLGHFPPAEMSAK